MGRWLAMDFNTFNACHEEMVDAMRRAVSADLYETMLSHSAIGYLYLSGIRTEVRKEKAKGYYAGVS